MRPCAPGRRQERADSCESPRWVAPYPAPPTHPSTSLPLLSLAGGHRSALEAVVRGRREGPGAAAAGELARRQLHNPCAPGSIAGERPSPPATLPPPGKGGRQAVGANEQMPCATLPPAPAHRPPRAQPARTGARRCWPTWPLPWSACACWACRRRRGRRSRRPRRRASYCCWTASPRRSAASSSHPTARQAQTPAR